ncbi:hypothetical protein ACJIZ3_025378 [Penstemon smallii]|uniref:GBF-interacting protein 1 N-terminal domain-containing protein n=1 Tax=Penstemon smallii TaxID=265156 RepID=A0ABD3TX34_9LAMI
MVLGSRIDGRGQVLSAGLRKTIQSIKEIVGNHSDADIYVALKETNMDPNETAQKLLNQDPFHEVKRKRDRKKENSGDKNFTAEEPRKNIELACIPPPVKQNAYSDRNARRGGFSRNLISDAGSSREFRVVRDNRFNQNAAADSKPIQSPTSTSDGVIFNGSGKSNVTGTSGRQKPPVGRHSPQVLNGPADSQSRQTRDAISSSNDRKKILGEKRLPIPSAASRGKTRANDSRLNSRNNSVVGVYSSSSDPVHVPSLHSKPAANVGAIRREVGVVGPHRQSSENCAKPSSSQIISLPNTQSGREGHSRESTRPFSSTSKSDQHSQNVAPESALSGFSGSNSFSSNQYGSSFHQFVGHRKAPQRSKEWKPKSSLKSSANGPGVIGTVTKSVYPPAENPKDLKKESLQMQDNVSRLNISENQNVIIAAHIRVSETDRCRLTFGSLGTQLVSSMNSVFITNEGAAELSTEPSVSVSGLGPESSGEEPAAGSEQLEMMDDSVRNSGSNSHASDDVSDHQPTEKKEVVVSQHNVDNYADVQFVRTTSLSHTPESLHQQDTSVLPSFSGYDPQMAYDMSYFPPIVDETVHGTGLPSPQEVLNSHTTNAIPASTIAMVQHQQQQQLAQMYPQLHVPHFGNLMPYRQFLSPVYVPPLPVPGYSNNSAYPHPSNGSSYLLMPGNNSHLTPSSFKYGIQQFKPVPTGSPTGFENFTSPTGYAISTHGVVGSTAGHEDSSRLKYKDNLYIQNPQAETSEIWMNPRDISSLQSASYYNGPGQTPHAYLASHNGHASFNAAAAAQSSHMQFQGMYHSPPQPAAIASHLHLGPANVGVGVGVGGPAPGAQVGAYQQPQMGHLNWTGNY